MIIIPRYGSRYAMPILAHIIVVRSAQRFARAVDEGTPRAIARLVVPAHPNTNDLLRLAVVSTTAPHSSVSCVFIVLASSMLALLQSQ